jgi:hypothetical protein
MFLTNDLRKYMSEVEYRFFIYLFIFFSFVGWSGTESTWYVGYQLACCPSPGW